MQGNQDREPLSGQQPIPLIQVLPDGRLAYVSLPMASIRPSAPQPFSVEVPPRTDLKASRDRWAGVIKICCVLMLIIGIAGLACRVYFLHAVKGRPQRCLWGIGLTIDVLTIVTSLLGIRAGVKKSSSAGVCYLRFLVFFAVVYVIATAGASLLGMKMELHKMTHDGRIRTYEPEPQELPVPPIAMDFHISKPAETTQTTVPSEEPNQEQRDRHPTHQDINGDHPGRPQGPEEGQMGGGDHDHQPHNNPGKDFIGGGDHDHQRHDNPDEDFIGGGDHDHTRHDGKDPDEAVMGDGDHDHQRHDGQEGGDHPRPRDQDDKRHHPRSKDQDEKKHHRRDRDEHKPEIPKVSAAAPNSATTQVAPAEESTPFFHKPSKGKDRKRRYGDNDDDDAPWTKEQVKEGMMIGIFVMTLLTIGMCSGCVFCASRLVKYARSYEAMYPRNGYPAPFSYAQPQMMQPMQQMQQAPPQPDGRPQVVQAVPVGNAGIYPQLAPMGSAVQYPQV